ncbi:MAG: PA0069 family radical SAM protein [Planctomycetia bacterium]|nr:PA0069 family radical SAM protein [Planctomycetia bacterium]
MPDARISAVAGRGSPLKPPNRFVPIHVEDDFEHFDGDDEFARSLQKVRTEYYPDDSQSVVTENNSPDVGFRYSLNPYRGCAHGCSYCYARPTHEYFGLNAGIDFETKVFVKEKAPELFRDFLARESWQPDVITFSGVTDCYQPAERHFRLTRQCLEVALEARQPISIVTKNALVTRDLDLLSEMAKLRVISVALSITSLDQSLARVMEPRTSSPAARLGAIEKLAAAGVPAMAMVAPVIPGLNDSEIPQILEAAKNAGARSAAYILLRLPLNVRPVFLDWLARTQPERKERVESRIRSTREGKLNDANFGSRMRGKGEIADQIARTFKVFARKHGLDRKLPEPDTSAFRRPRTSSGQLHLF